MGLSFKRATKHESRLRLAFVGPAGSGKTFSSLSVAAGLGGRIALIDTERGSASKYADLFDFDVLELDSFAPSRFVQAIRAAEEAGYDIIIIDSLSHAWMGRDGALEQVDNHARKSGGAGNSFAAWRHVTPKHNEMVDAIIGCRAHVIATMRAKTEWVVEKDKNGKSVPRKIGLAPVQRDGLEYEFDVVGDLDIENCWTVTKTRCPDLTGKLIDRPGEQVAEVLRAWLQGAPRPAAEEAPTPPTRPAVVGGESVEIEDIPPDADEPAAEPAPLDVQIVACKSLEDLAKLRSKVTGLPHGSKERKRLAELYNSKKAELRDGRGEQRGAA